jgi:hypothetical protein
LLQQELVQIRRFYEEMEKDKENTIDLVNRRVEAADRNTDELKATKHKNECLIAELERRLAEA